MIRKFVKRLVLRAKEVARAIFAKIGAAIREVTPSVPAYAGIRLIVAAAQHKDALNFGKPYRLTSGHAPIFSLFTYFGLRQ
jgi:hypothetical protein